VIFMDTVVTFLLQFHATDASVCIRCIGMHPLHRYASVASVCIRCIGMHPLHETAHRMSHDLALCLFYWFVKIQGSKLSILHVSL